MILKNMLFIMAFLWAFNAYAIENKDEKATREASLLVREYAFESDGNIKIKIINNLSSLFESNQDNSNVVRVYSGVLSSRGEYKKTIAVLESFNRKHKDASLLLHECMLKDRIGNYEPSCYKKVISLKKTNGVNDIDYLMALFMISDKTFNREKNLYMKGRDDNDDLKVFNTKKENLLKILYPD